MSRRLVAKSLAARDTGQDDTDPHFARSPMTGPDAPNVTERPHDITYSRHRFCGVSGEDVLLSEARIISEPLEAHESLGDAGTPYPNAEF